RELVAGSKHVPEHLLDLIHQPEKRGVQMTQQAGRHSAQHAWMAHARAGTQQQARRRSKFAEAFRHDGPFNAMEPEVVSLPLNAASIAKRKHSRHRLYSSRSARRAILPRARRVRWISRRPTGGHPCSFRTKRAFLLALARARRTSHRS